MPMQDQSTGQLRGAIAQIRLFLDDPSVRVKYSDTKILDLMNESYQEILRDVYAMALNKLTMKFPITFTDGTDYYQLPPTVGEVIGITYTNDYGSTEVDLLPRPWGSPYEFGWKVEAGGRLYVKPTLGLGWPNTLDLEYVPSGDVVMHVGRIDKTTATTTKIYMGEVASPTVVGSIDRRPHAYKGCYLSLFAHENTAQKPAGYDRYPIQQRIISTWDVASGETVVDPAFDFDPSTLNDAGSLYSLYEVYPMEAQLVMPAVIRHVARNIAIIEDRMTKAKGMERLYAEAKRSVALAWASAQSRRNTRMSNQVRDNYDYPFYGWY